MCSHTFVLTDSAPRAGVRETPCDFSELRPGFTCPDTLFAPSAREPAAATEPTEPPRPPRAVLGLLEAQDVPRMQNGWACPVQPHLLPSTHLVTLSPCCLAGKSEPSKGHCEEHVAPWHRRRAGSRSWRREVSSPRPGAARSFFGARDALASGCLLPHQKARATGAGMPSVPRTSATPHKRASDRHLTSR